MGDGRGAEDGGCEVGGVLLGERGGDGSGSRGVDGGGVDDDFVGDGAAGLDRGCDAG